MDRSEAVGPAKYAFDIKSQIRRTIEAEGIPYTYIISGCFSGSFLSTLAQLDFTLTAPPRDKVVILGDGNPKGKLVFIVHKSIPLVITHLNVTLIIVVIFNEEDDIGTYTIKAVDDPRTLNKSLYIKPSKNIYSFNDLVSLWESKIGHKLERTYLPEEQILKQIQGIIIKIYYYIPKMGDTSRHTIICFGKPTIL